MIDINRINKRVKKILFDNNWSADRFVEQIKYPINEFEFPDFVKKILNNFYGMEIQTEPTEIIDKDGSIVTYNNGIMEFYPEFAQGENQEGGVFKYYEKLLNKTFYPIGEITDGPFYVVIDDDLILYIMGDIIFKMGNDFNESFEAIITCLKGKKLNEDTLEWENY